MRVGEMTRFPFVILLFSLLSPTLASAVSLDDVVQANRGSVVFIKAQKVNPMNGAITEVEGTGFIVSKSGLVVTSGHVVSSAGAAEVDIRGAVASREGTLEGMEVIYENSNMDVALLRFKNTAPARTPIVIGDPWKVSDAATVYAMGFPTKEEWFHTEGKLSGKGAPRGSWNTTMVLNPGMSGGPVFNSDGQVIAMVWGASSTSGILGINRVLPINLLAEPLRLAGAVPVTAVTPLTDPTTPASQIVEVVYRIDQTQESLGGLTSASLDYRKDFQARTGFRFKDYTVVSRSVNNATITAVTISSDRKTLTVTFSLKSGPIFDRWRGWLDVDYLTRQEPDKP